MTIHIAEIDDMTFLQLAAGNQSLPMGRRGIEEKSLLTSNP
jgi:hypothetical protein